MIERLLVWGWNRFRPREGWLAFLLLAAAVTCLVAAVLEIAWVPEGWIVIPTAGFGLLLGTVLAKRPLHSAAAWLLLTLYGFLVTTLWLGHFWPPLHILINGLGAIYHYWRQMGALFADRSASWFQAAFTGGTSQETIVFAFGMGLLTWFLAAYVGWSAFRQRRPLLGLTAMGVAVAVNGYYGAGAIYWAAFFVGLAALVAAVLHYTNLEQEWQARGVDYSGEIRLELVLYAGVIATALLFLAMALPAFSITELSRALLRQPAVSQAEQTLSRVFAGVQPPRIEEDTGVGASGPGGSGILPRAYLLGAPPELQQTVVMTAVLTTTSDTANPAILHWRGLSYDIYTGRGWTLSEERRHSIPAGQPIDDRDRGDAGSTSGSQSSLLASQLELNQSVSWIFDQRPARYTIGLPLIFDQEVVASWRGLEDLVRVQGRGGRYQATSHLAAATPAELRTARMFEAPPSIIARYTALPPSVPDRVLALAQQVAADLPTAYDQAQALERFLRQYPYSLEVAPPPPDVDPVDFFLFELQQGYCDYYASAMVVMARSLGLPARLGVGFLAQPPDEQDVQTIRQLNAHSWAEIYFAGYGWVEFEPTATFPSPYSDEQAALSDNNGLDQLPSFETPPIPLPTAPTSLTERLWPFGWLAIVTALLLLAAALWWWRQQRQVSELDRVRLAYGRLQRRARQLGQPLPPSQTPSEFTADLLARLETFERQPRLARLVQRLYRPIEQLARLFILRQYSYQDEARVAAETAEAQQLWQRLRRPLWLLRLIGQVTEGIHLRRTRRK